MNLFNIFALTPISRSAAWFTPPYSPRCSAEWLHVKEIVSSNIQLLYAWRPSPTLNWFLTEREASLSTDTQPCFPHLPHPTQITPPSALPHRIVHSPPFFPLLPSFLSSVIISSSSPLRSPSDFYAAVCGRRRPRLPRRAFNLSLISLHCNGKWFCVLPFDWSCKPAPHHRGTSWCLGVGGVFNFALAQNVFYQRIHISNTILHINQAVCKWPNRKIAKSGDREIEPERKMKKWLPLTEEKKRRKKKNYTELNGCWKTFFIVIFWSRIGWTWLVLFIERSCFHLELPPSSCESFLPSS